VLFGGRSAEREVSIMSGTAVLNALQGLGADAHAFDPGTRSLADLESAGFERVFIALHGRFGEDGTIQGVLETLGIPYTGSGVLASAIALDKLVTKSVWRAAGLPTPGWRLLERNTDWPGVVAGLGDELVVKPVSEGSSFGITKVTSHDRDELAQAFEAAARYDRRVFAEELVRGREITCAVLGEGAAARALPLIEIRAPGDNYDYEHKYFSDDTQYLCPAPIDPSAARAIEQLCVRAYNAIGARGWGRIDLMLRGEGPDASPFLLELNTSPGMTGHSLVPMAARVAGIGFPQLVLKILAAARLESGR
jgi:D-alanine-D-alanine ligase